MAGRASRTRKWKIVCWSICEPVSELPIYRDFSLFIAGNILEHRFLEDLIHVLGEEFIQAITEVFVLNAILRCMLQVAFGVRSLRALKELPLISPQDPRDTGNLG
jgi:hypothetical protein